MQHCLTGYQCCVKNKLLAKTNHYTNKPEELDVRKAMFWYAGVTAEQFVMKQRPESRL